MLFAKRLVFWLMCLHFVVSPYNFNDGLIASEISSVSEVESIHCPSPVKISIFSEEASIQPGHPFSVAIQLEIDDDWHTYWKNPGDAGMPPMISWNLPSGFQAGPLLWPTPKRFQLASAIGFGYEKNLILLTQITPPSSYSEQSATLLADVRWVVCSDSTCLPGDEQMALSLSVNSDKPLKVQENTELFRQARAKIPKKHDVITAKRKKDFIEIAFHHAIEKGSLIYTAEFFPEHRTAINLNAPSSLQQPTTDSSPYIMALKELSFQDSLKGVIVLHTTSGTEAYEVDIPITSSLNRSDSLVSMTSGIEAKNEAVAKATESSPLEKAELPFEFEGGVAFSIVLAFIGGMILNLMPCVLPVISFKVLGFIKLAGQSRRLIIQHGLAFSTGVLLSFWVLASFLLVLQAYGRSAGWGFQLQEPLFVALLAALLFIFGLSLFGVFELGSSLMSAAGEAQQKVSKRYELLSSFFSGILATALATPCTGPFLGSAVGFAVTLPPLQALLIFTSIGLGMSFPYLGLTAFPSLLRFMPKPGPWMITFKELMGFLMMASTVWLISVYAAQTNTFSVSLLLGSFFFLAFACWIYGRWATPFYKRLTRTLATFVSILFFGFGSYILVISTSTWVEEMSAPPSKMGNSIVADSWEEFSPERVEELRKKGIPIFIDFTAKWCLICQTNHLVLSGEEISAKFRELNVVKMKADWTKNNEIIAAELRRFGRNSVPLYILYDSNPESDPKILPQLLTADIVLDSLKSL